MRSSLWQERLLSLLQQQTPPGGTCLIAAAPGYGATTLLRRLVHASSEPVWDLVVPAAADALQSLARRLGLPEDHGADDVLDALSEQPPCWLVIDDVQDDWQVVDLAARLPATARLALATHGSLLGGPTFAGRVVEISEGLLKLRLDEAVELLDTLDLDAAEAVWTAADGWLAALLLASTPAANASGDRARWLGSQGAQRLFHDWFQGLPRSTRDFLVATAVVDDLEPAVCNAIVGRDDGAAMLAALARHHSFVERMPDGDTSRWRRHPLLTAFLRQSGEHTRGAIDAHSRAADWYRSQDAVEPTMHHLLAAGRTAEAGEFLREHEAELFRWGRAAEALEWYRKLPRQTHGQAIQQVLRVGWGHAYSADVPGAEMWLERLKCLLADAGDSVADSPEAAEAAVRLEGETDTLDAYVAAFHGDAQRMLAAAERAVAAFDGSTERDSEQISHLLLVKALQWAGDTVTAGSQLATLEHRQFANDMVRESTLAALKARQLRSEGRIHHAVAVADRAWRWIETMRLDPMEMRLVNVTAERAAAWLERGDVQTAEPDLLAALKAQRASDRSGDAVTTLVELARLRWVTGDPAAALRHLQKARSLLNQSAPGSMLLATVDAAEARVRIGMGDGVRAERLIRTLPRSEERSLLWSRLSLARGGDVRRTLTTLEPSNPRSEAELHLLRGWSMRRRSLRVAQAHLVEAADIAVANGQGLLLADAGPDLRELAEETALAHSHDGLRWLLAVLGQESVRAVPATTALSPGELRLITMLPSRDTIAAIGSQLSVTENTVKTRLRRLYRKLGVNSRDEAIAVARSRGLL